MQKMLSPGTVRLNGPLGATLNKVISNRLLTVDYAKMVEPFRLRYEDDNAWRCEFWGKVVRSAIFAWRSTGDAKLKTLLDSTVEQMLAAQHEDGSITSYPAGKEIWQGWDVWGRKYVLTALEDYYEHVEQSPAVLEAIKRMLHNFLDNVNGRIYACGEHFGAPASSILRSMLRAARLTGEKRFMEEADKLVKIGCSRVVSLFKAARLKTAPCVIGNGKAYEITSCFQGLAELYRITNDRELLTILENYYTAVRDQEIFLTGGGGMGDKYGEFWFEGKKNQVRTDRGGTGETCITATWIAFCRDMLELTEDSTIADEMERSFYNALLGAFTEDGTTCSHVNPFLSGGDYRTVPGDQIDTVKQKPFDKHDCCRAQGPYGLALAPAMAVTKTEDGYAVNLYEDLEAKDILRIDGGFPAADNAKITVLKDGEYTLSLRIPAGYGCKVNGKEAVPGTYMKLAKNWKCGDTVELAFDFTMQTCISECGDFKAYTCGPLVMAEDSRKKDFKCLRKNSDLVDYSSAGSLFSPENTLQVWFPVK